MEQVKIPKGWFSMGSAPRDTPIIGWCVHSENLYVCEDGRLAPYGAHAEGLGHATDGYHILEWGGAVNSYSWEYPGENFQVKDWWFVHGSQWEVPANPVMWAPLPAPPEPPEP